MGFRTWVSLLVFFVGCATRGYVSEGEKAALKEDRSLATIIDAAEKHGFKLYRYRLNDRGGVDAVLIGEIHSALYDILIHNFLDRVLTGGEIIYAEGSCDREYQKEDHEALTGLTQDIRLYGWDIKSGEKDLVLIHTGRVIAMSDALMKFYTGTEALTDFEQWVIYEETECCKRGEPVTREKLLRQYAADEEALERYEIRRDDALSHSILRRHRGITYAIAGCFHIDSYQDLSHGNDRVLNQLEGREGCGYLAFLPIEDPYDIKNYDVIIPGASRLRTIAGDIPGSREDYKRVHSLKILRWYVEAVERVYGKKFNGEITYTGNPDFSMWDDRSGD